MTLHENFEEYSEAMKFQNYFLDKKKKKVTLDNVWERSQDIETIFLWEIFLCMRHNETSMLIAMTANWTFKHPQVLRYDTDTR
jgi:hypothetical protein